MPFRSIVASPEDIAEMMAALESAWTAIQSRRASDPLSVAAERERLAYIIAGFWERGEFAGSCEKAVERFFAMAASAPSPRKLAEGEEGLP